MINRMRSILVTGMVLTLAVAAGACKSGPDDAALTQSVKAKIQSAANLAGAKIEVAVKDGAVTLTGTADNDAAKAAAEGIAKAVEGVKSVKNDITVKPPAATAAPADAGNDAAIKKAVTDSLTKAGITGVTVDVAAGVVTLKGEVAKGSKIKAMQAANEANPKPAKVVAAELTEK